MVSYLRKFLNHYRTKSDNYCLKNIKLVQKNRELIFNREYQMKILIHFVII